MSESPEVIGRCLCHFSQTFKDHLSRFLEDCGVLLAITREETVSSDMDVAKFVVVMPGDTSFERIASADDLTSLVSDRDNPEIVSFRN